MTDIFWDAAEQLEQHLAQARYLLVDQAVKAGWKRERLFFVPSQHLRAGVMVSETLTDEHGSVGLLEVVREGDVLKIYGKAPGLVERVEVGGRFVL